MMKCVLFLVAIGLQFNAEEAKNRPVSKVITLLKDMQKQLDKEGEEDQEIYDKMACWCTTNDKEKSQAIKDAEQLIDQLTTKIEELTGKAARLNTEIEDLTEEVAQNQKALDKATALREKRMNEFNKQEQDMLTAIDQMNRAIEALKKHQGSLIQESTLVDLASLLHHQMESHAYLLDTVMNARQREVLRAFVQAPAYNSYNSQSGEIFGILQQMQETFEKDLSEAQETERKQQAAYEQLKEAKEEEIAAGQALIEKKTVELAETNEENAASKDLLEDTKNTLSADEQFLMNLKEKCALTDKEFEQRQKTRSEEIQAVSKAIEVLSNDDAKDTFSGTFNFLEISDKQKQAAQVLVSAAGIRHNPRIAQLAARAKLDAFSKVKKAIDDMITQLKKEKEDEVKHKDWCDTTFRQSQTDRQNARHEEDKLSVSKGRLEERIQQLANMIATLTKEISELKVQIKRAGEDREEQNSEFQKTVEEQRATQQLLNKALNVLNSFYAKEKKSFVQKEPAGPPPPKGFSEYKNNAQSGGVLNMIQQIIDDAKAMGEEAIQGELDSQTAYEQFIQDSNTSVENKRKARTGAQAEKAQAEGDLADTKASISENAKLQESLADDKAATHKACDFTMKNFEVRQDARDQEISALGQAKAILSGSKFDSFLQRW